VVAAVLLLASLACERASDPTDESDLRKPAPSPQASRPRPVGAPAVVVRLPVREPSQATASLSVRLIDGHPHLREAAIGRLDVFEDSRPLGTVLAGQGRTFSIAATSPELQRITLDDTTFLLDPRPDESFALINGYPGLWDLRGRPPTAGIDGVTCVGASERCPPMSGAIMWGEPGCEDEAQFICAPLPRIRVRGPAKGPIVAEYADPTGAFSDVGPETMSEGDLPAGAETMWMPLQRNFHRPPTVSVGDLEATLVLPAGAWWEIWVDAAGQLTGRAIAPPKEK
jgi:hypothetical protein